jgi:hypothetical protein
MSLMAAYAAGRADFGSAARTLACLWEPAPLFTGVGNTSRTAFQNQGAAVDDGEICAAMMSAVGTG